MFLISLRRLDVYWTLLKNMKRLISIVLHDFNDPFFVKAESTFPLKMYFQEKFTLWDENLS